MIFLKNLRIIFQKKSLTFTFSCAIINTLSIRQAQVAELADAQDLKSCGKRFPCRFDPGLRHHHGAKLSLLRFVLQKNTCPLPCSIFLGMRFGRIPIQFSYSITEQSPRSSGLCFIESASVSVRITRQGFPAAKLCGGIERVTTLPAPITQPSPIVTPGRIVTFAQIQQPFPIRTGFV